MGDSDFDPNAAAGEIVKEALESELVKDLLGPMAQNIGLIFGQISDIARFYTEDNLAKIFKKWAHQRRGKPLDAETFKRVFPLLRDAAMQSDDELQERWASLLENLATAANGVLPSFGQVLSQLTPTEARYLDRIWETVSAPKDYNSGKREGRDELGFVNLVDIYNPKLRAPSPAEMKVFKDRISTEQIAAFEEMTDFELMLNDLERLNLLEKTMAYVPGRMNYIEVDGAEVPAGLSEGGMKITYALTQYGVSFILAVRPKRVY
jgi:Abortive infection alpha